jgi:hypothetical protein
MSRRRRREDDYVIARETPEERALLESGQQLRVPELIRQTTDIRADGSAMHSTSVARSAGWDKRPAAVLPSTPTDAVEGGPVFDVLELEEGDRDTGDASVEVQEGRALRDSVSHQNRTCAATKLATG